MASAPAVSSTARRRAARFEPKLGRFAIAAALAGWSGLLPACGSSPAPPVALASQARAGQPSALHVNQLGYLPALAKRATLQSDAESPLPFRLLDAHGRTLLEGETRVHGFDAASGDRVHVIDFSAARAPGRGYRLQAAGQYSQPFAIAQDVYRGLRWDALRFFYQQRSGIAIELPFAGQARWTRPAGHPGDRSVGCADGSCSYTLDAAGGWYDAGDHGKYVVNGGVAVWTLLDLYERSALAGTRAALADGSQNIPEHDNGVSDLLDEARWELEFLLRMQVQEGQPLAGMAHHKLHDVDWTPLPTAPDADPLPRTLRPPSTAATLNLAAVAAQAARVYRDVDAAFSERCGQAARRAFAAARQNPERYAPAEDHEGGGAYDDTHLADEFYWAAAELLITTGDAEYASFVSQAAIDAAFFSSASQPQSLTWQDVAAAGTISLAFAAADSLAAQREQARAVIRRAADVLVGVRAAQGYGVPYAGQNGAYPWGSSSYVLNAGLVLAVAYQLGGAEEHLAGAVSSLDYVLGDNPLDQSYVTGYGARPLRNPHHRYFAHALDPKLPEAPPGFVSGGPNSGLQDPVARAALAGCAPQRCFLDDIRAFSTNEVAINWNAPLAWLAAFLDERAHAADGG